MEQKEIQEIVGCDVLFRGRIAGQVTSKCSLTDFLDPTILIRTDGTVAENQIIAPELDREISRVIRRQKRAKAQAAKVRNNSR